MKIAIVTGGSRGLGKSAALALADKGVDVILTYNSRVEEAQQVVAEIEKKGRKAVALQLDVSNTKNFPAFVASVKEALEKTWKTNSFQFLINNAGTGLHALFTETTEEQFDNLVNIHFKGPYFLTQRLLPLMSDGGRIINLSSGLARFAFPGSSAYGALKGAVDVWTRYLAKELGPRKITANAVAPGAIETDFSGGRVRDDKETNKMVSSVTALGRAGLPEDIGPLIAAMTTEDTRWINGQRVEASGGMML